MDTNKTMNNKIFQIFLLVFLLGLGLRLLYCIKYPVPVRDSYEYYEYIVRWKEEGTLPTYRVFPPLALYLYKTVDDLTSCGIIKSAIIINIVVGELLICIVVYTASRYRFSILSTLLLGILVATHPTLIYYSCQPLRENLYLLFCSLFAISFITYAQSRKFIDLAGQALFCSLALLARKESLELVFLPVVLLGLTIKSIPLYITALRIIAYFSIIAIIILLFSFLLHFDLGYLVGYFNEIPTA